MAIRGYNRFFSILLILQLVTYTLMTLDNVFVTRELVAANTPWIEATAKVDKKEVTIGDKIKFSIFVKYKDDLTVLFPELNEKLGVFAIKKMEGVEIPRQEKDGYFIVERSYVLSTYEIGSQTIHSLNIKYSGNHGEGKVVTNEVTIEVKGVLKEGEIASDIKDIQAPVNVPTNFWRLVLWLFVGMVVLLLSGVIYWFISKWKEVQQKREIQLTKRAPHEVAYELLERLAREDLVAKGLVKEYYYRITNIVRHYIEDRFGLLAPERTTEEFLMEMAHANTLDTAHKALIQEFLEHCDMVKYSKYGPSSIEIKETYEVARRLIDETKEPGEKKEVVAI